VLPDRSLDPELDPPPELPVPLEPPELDAASWSAPVDPLLLEPLYAFEPLDGPPLLLEPLYAFEPLDGPPLLLEPLYAFEPLDVLPLGPGFELPVLVPPGLDDPLLHATAMIDPAARAAIEMTFRFLIKSLSQRSPRGHRIMPRGDAPVMVMTNGASLWSHPDVLQKSVVRVRWLRARSRSRLRFEPLLEIVRAADVRAIHEDLRRACFAAHRSQTPR